MSTNPIWETLADLGALYRALDDAERRRDAADALADLCGGGNYEAEFELADYEVSRIQARIDEIEDREARSEERELCSDFYASR